MAATQQSQLQQNGNLTGTDKETRKNIYDSLGFDWESYITHRPVYSDEFFTLILSHHSIHGGRSTRDGNDRNPTTLHDLGTGPGLVAQSLSPYFDEVVATDASATYTALASARLRSLPASASAPALGSAPVPPNFTVRTSRAEDLAGWMGRSSVDMITTAEAIHWASSTAVVNAASHCLRSGGTLAVWDYGAPVFDLSYESGKQNQNGSVDGVGIGKGGVGEDHPDAGTVAQEKRAQSLLQEIIERSFDRMRDSFPGGPFVSAATMLRSYMDDIAFPKHGWEHVRRLKWNTDHPLEILDHTKLSFEVPVVSNVKEGEEVVQMRDRGFWGLEVDVQWLRGYVEHIGPGKETDQAKMAHIEDMWSQLGEVMGGKKRWVTWCVVLLLATRK